MTKDENINSIIEAMILSSPEPVSIKRICEVMESVSPVRVRQGIDDLNSLYLGCGNSFRIRELAGGYQFYILPDFEQPIKMLLTKQRTVRLSRPALETLAIIAYKQPVTKTEIEHIRGVASDGVLHNLLQRNLIIMAGRSDSPGRPLIYKTSDEFLKYFGLNRISDLPRMDEIEEMIRQSEPPREQTVLPFSEESSGNDNGGEFSDEDVVFEETSDELATASNLSVSIDTTDEFIEEEEASDSDALPNA